MLGMTECQGLFLQVDTVNGKANFVRTHFFHRVLAFVFNKLRCFVAWRGFECYIEFFLSLFSGAKDQLLSALGVTRPFSLLIRLM